VHRPTVAAYLLALAPSLAFAQSWIPQASGATASLRGVSAVSAAIVWASGSGGVVLRTENGGAAWHSLSVPGAKDLDFRSVRALDGRTAWIMSSGPGEKSRILRTADRGEHWYLLYTNPDASGFLDALAFWDARRAVVLGDPVAGQFVILTTADAGQTWQRRKLPPALPGEGAFAASNSCLLARGKHEIWFATGGPSASRVFHSSDGGEHWEVAAAPLRHDGPAAGIFSLAFSGALHGVAVGGDYSQPADTTANAAVTFDGGRTWNTTPGPHPAGYRSAVAFLPGRQVCIAVGTSGSDISRDAGRNWTAFDTGPYNAIGVASAAAVWAVGPGGRIGKLRFN